MECMAFMRIAHGGFIEITGITFITILMCCLGIEREEVFLRFCRRPFSWVESVASNNCSIGEIELWANSERDGEYLLFFGMYVESPYFWSEFEFWNPQKAEQGRSRRNLEWIMPLLYHQYQHFTLFRSYLHMPRIFSPAYNFSLRHLWLQKQKQFEACNRYVFQSEVLKGFFFCEQIWESNGEKCEKIRRITVNELVRLNSDTVAVDSSVLDSIHSKPIPIKANVSEKANRLNACGLWCTWALAVHPNRFFGFEYCDTKDGKHMNARAIHAGYADIFLWWFQWIFGLGCIAVPLLWRWCNVCGPMQCNGKSTLFTHIWILQFVVCLHERHAFISLRIRMQNTALIG